MRDCGGESGIAAVCPEGMSATQRVRGRVSSARGLGKHRQASRRHHQVFTRLREPGTARSVREARPSGKRFLFPPPKNQLRKESGIIERMRFASGVLQSSTPQESFRPQFISALSTSAYREGEVSMSRKAKSVFVRKPRITHRLSDVEHRPTACFHLLLLAESASVFFHGGRMYASMAVYSTQRLPGHRRARVCGRRDSRVADNRNGGHDALQRFCSRRIHESPPLNTFCMQPPSEV